MTRPLLPCLLLAVAVSACAKEPEKKASLVERASSDQVHLVEDGDPLMDAAFAKARASLDGFLSTWRAPPPGAEGFAVKLPVVDGEHTEFFWIGLTAVDGDRLQGTLNNPPRLVGNVQAGQLMAFDRADVVDWTYRHAGKMHGNFTACAMLARESPEQQAQFRAEYGLDCEA